jgi:hypothetical protein
MNREELLEKKYEIEGKKIFGRSVGVDDKLLSDRTAACLLKVACENKLHAFAVMVITKQISSDADLTDIEPLVADAVRKSELKCAYRKARRVQMEAERKDLYNFYPPGRWSNKLVSKADKQKDVEVWRRNYEKTTGRKPLI